MDIIKTNSKPNPREKANIFSILTWIWTYDIFKKGYGKVFGIEDLYDPINTHRSKLLGDRLEKQWFAELEQSEKHKCQPSFLRAIWRTFAKEICLVGLMQMIFDFILRLGSPLLLRRLLQYFKPDSMTTYETALLYATAIVIVSLSDITLRSQSSFLGQCVGSKIRIATSSIIYRKALRLSKTAMNETAPGKIVNLVASDVNMFNPIIVFIHYIWNGPLLALTTMMIIYFEIGWSAFVGMSIVFLLVTFQAYLSQITSKYRSQIAVKSDERVRLMDEIISGVQVIKLYSWEKPFCAMVTLARFLEMKIIKKSVYIQAVAGTLPLFISRAAIFGTIITMMLRDQEITAEKVYVYISYFNLISLLGSELLVRAIAVSVECRVSVRRLQNFLMFQEFESQKENDGKSDWRSGKSIMYENQFKENLDMMRDGTSIMGSFKVLNECNTENTKLDDWPVIMNHVMAKWDLNSTEPTLNEIDLRVVTGKLYVVIGMVGAGKSSLISLILGELKSIRGRITVNGSVSYADQEPWVFDATIRQNITFGQQFDGDRYEKVVAVCALQKDFKQFPLGDQTIVGERGRTLSGGQKARVNLARAVYRDADIYLLDDPLSAVDAHVGKHLFEECLQKYLANKTRILATHQLQHIKVADAIILVDQGKIYEYADYHELLRVRPEYNSILGEEERKDLSEETMLDDSVIGKLPPKFVEVQLNGEEIIDGQATDQADKTEQSTESRRDFYESTSRGTVKGSLLIKYLRSGSNIFGAISLLFLILITQFLVIGNDYFISRMVNIEESSNRESQLLKINTSSYYNNIELKNKTNFFNNEDVLSRDYYTYIYITILASILLMCVIRSIWFYRICLNASQRLHDLAYAALIRAKIRFFNTNPSGRILNRFSKDLGAIDAELSKSLCTAIQNIFTAIGAILVACSVNAYFLVPVFVVGGLFFLLRKIYLKTSKNIKRLEGITRSPVFTLLNTTLNGITTIRACGTEKMLKNEFDKLQDTHTSSWYMFTVIGVAFGLSLDVCCLLLTGTIVFSSVLLKNNFNGSEVGLAVSQLASLTGLLQWGMRQSADVENHLTSVERVLEYSQLPSEPNLRDKGLKKDNVEKTEKQLVDPPENWPSDGQIKFKKVSMCYSDDDPLALKNLSFVVQPNEKIGIVGRTGAGKSSLINALFRLTKVEGVIEIDGIDTGTIALEDLRKSISIIPQDPVLFSGTLRRNLDPFDEFSDELLWNALEEVELKEFVKLNGDGLNHRVMDRGSNFSVGQRQLVCLARAILRNNRILVLDEATANVDPQTDALIQRTIRLKFASCTILTVAHRLNTIIDSDKVLVMKAGEAVEFDHPYLLLRNQHGSFSTLLQETGSAMFEHLSEIAENVFKSQKSYIK